MTTSRGATWSPPSRDGGEPSHSSPERGGRGLAGGRSFLSFKTHPLHVLQYIYCVCVCVCVCRAPEPYVWKYIY